MRYRAFASQMGLVTPLAPSVTTVSGRAIILNSNGEVECDAPSPTAGQSLITQGSADAKATLRCPSRAKSDDWDG